MLLAGKKGLVLCVTNEYSIGWAVADFAHSLGAEVGVGAQNDKMAERVNRLIEGREHMQMHVVDFQEEETLERLATEVAEKYGKIDFLVHSAAYALREDLQGRFIDTSRDGFKLAMEVSAYSLVRVSNVLEPLLNDDASIVTMTYLGSARAIPNYNVMGVAKAALESCVRYLALDLGPRGIRVNAVSPGPLNTVAARGVRGLQQKIDTFHERAPLKRTFTQDEAARTTAYLISDLGRGVSGQTVYVDNGCNISGF